MIQKPIHWCSYWFYMFRLKEDRLTWICPQAEAVLDTAVRLWVNEFFTEQNLKETVEAIRKVALIGKHCCSTIWIDKTCRLGKYHKNYAILFDACACSISVFHNLHISRCFFFPRVYKYFPLFNKAEKRRMERRMRENLTVWWRRNWELEKRAWGLK